MKKFFMGVLLVSILLSLILSGCSAPAATPAPTTPAPTPPPQSFKLGFTTYWPEASSQWTGAYKPILDDIAQKSNGRIAWTTFLGGALGGGADIYDAVATGKADFGSTGLGYNPGRFPLHDVFTLPGAFESSKAAGDVALELFDRILAKELVGTQPIAVQQTQTFFIYTSKKQINTMEDMKGLKIRSPGGLGTATLQALGATPITMALGDVYLSLQTGLIDGVVTGPSALFGFKLNEVLKYVVRFPIIHGSNDLFFNTTSWGKLPADLQKIVKDSCKAFAYTEVNLFVKDDPVQTKILVDKGGAAVTFTADETTRWRTTLKPVFDTWYADMKAKGKAIDELLPIVREVTKKYNVPFPY